MRSMRAAAVMLVALLLVGAGCGGESKQDKAMADVCAARDNITKQLDTLKNLTPTTVTTDKVTGALSAIRDDLTKIGNAMGDLSEDRRKEVQAANEKFAAAVRSTLQKVGTSVSLADAASQIKTAFADLESSYRSTFGKLDCS